MMQSADSEKSFARLSPFAIQKGILGVTGAEPKTIKRLRSGDLLIEVAKKAHSNSLQNTKTIANTPITVTPHRTLNSSKGVIRCHDLTTSKTKVSLMFTEFQLLKTEAEFQLQL